MNISKKTKTLTFLAILVALMLIMGFTPIGFIPLGAIKITLMCLPVIIGTLTLGLKTGFMLGVVFFITSFAQLLMAPDAVSVLLFEASPSYVLSLLIPRLLIPLVAYYVYKLLKFKKAYVNTAIASLAGSLTNTFIYLGMVYFMFAPALQEGLALSVDGVAAMIGSVILLNGLPEAVFAMLVCPPIVAALQKSVILLERKQG